MYKWMQVLLLCVHTICEIGVYVDTRVWALPCICISAYVPINKKKQKKLSIKVQLIEQPDINI